MPKNNPNAFRRDRVRELEDLADVLNQELGIDTQSLYKAASDCRIDSGSTWGYRLERLIFPIRHFHRAVPRRILKETVSLALTVDVSGHCLTDGEIRDPFDALEFNILLVGQRVAQNTNLPGPAPIMCSWHLDRHEFLDERNAEETEDTDNREEEEEAKDESEFIHPFYHFQYGGHRTWESGYDFGASLILEAPRFAHPPMDAILGIDFVLTNFFKVSELEFRLEGAYVNRLKAAQERIWRPYAQALAHMWHPVPISCSWNGQTLWPQIP